jgi:dihydrofolate reductase
MPGERAITFAASFRLTDTTFDRKETEMRKVTVDEFTSLDGVAQAPGGEDEDTSDGFAHGGWQIEHSDELVGQRVRERIEAAGGFLLGRLTYDVFAAYWPNAPDETRAIKDPLNSKPKYVASTTLGDPLSWENSIVLQGDLAEAVEALKREDGGDLHVIGSTRLVQWLLARGLVDELRLVIYPVLLGGGKRPFPEDQARRRLRLVQSEATSTGVILATYAPAGA